MPYYFSKSRQGKNSPGQRNAGKIDRVRSPPSSFAPLVLSTRDSWIFALVFEYMHIIVNLLMMFAQGIPSIRSSDHPRSKVLSVEPSSTYDFPISIPGLVMRFKNPDSKLTATTLETLADLGFSSRSIRDGSRSFSVWVKEKPEQSDLAAVKAFIPLLEPTYTKPGVGYITPLAIGTMEHITTTVSGIAVAFMNIIASDKPTDDSNISFNITGPWNAETQDLHKEGLHTHSSADPHHVAAPKGDDTVLPDADEEKGWKQYVSPFSGVRLSLANSIKSVEPAFGPISQLPFTSGLSFPFVRDYSQQDPNGLSPMLTQYPRIFMSTKTTVSPPEQFKNLNEYWFFQISNTPHGHHLAHIFRVLDICRSAKTRAYFVFTGTRYDGAVLEGTFTKLFSSTGHIFQGSAAGPEFTEEISHLSRHEHAIRRIKDISKLTFPGEIKTMRQFSDLVGRKALTDAQKSEVMELLAEVDFGEVPTILAPGTLDSFYSYVLSGVPPPHSVFLRRDDFFLSHSVDLVRTSLSMFGDNAPHFNSGSTHRPLVRSAETPKSKYVADAPRFLHVVRTGERDKAVTAWKSLIATRMLAGEWEQRKEGLRIFSGETKVQVWSGLESFAAECAKRDKGSAVSDEIEAGVKRGREGDSDGKGKKVDTGDRAEGEAMFDDLF